MSTIIDEKWLAEVQAICDEATPGPWTKPFDDGAIAKPDGTSLLALDRDDMAIVDLPADAAFIAFARTALPEAIAEIRRLREELWSHAHAIAVLGRKP